ncbi:Fasciclin-domain-containing protein [Bimuria novae-zelandiae CBS 107.79]|uniref:Fasciclin-domain-containing protein n=1 Tax=Bimuria novae-zelandiae CBS 107.79 TaxID=1447943 RepID=A0A6A5UZV6_9PLEO|nr:Fasciclin-domain-containing protein [Bimuria novae-zelandiae CBS 107.79]
MRTTITLAAYISAVLAQSTSLTELIQSQPDLSTLGTALSLVPELLDTLGGLQGITILAPTNSAFEALLAQNTTQESFSISQSDAQAVASILAYHVLNGTYTSSDFSGVPTYVNTLLAPTSGVFPANVTEGQNLGLVLNGENATILSGELQSANVVEADIQAVSGVTVHKIDEVLVLPRSLSETLSRLPQVGVSAAVGALTATNLVQTIEEFADLTIFIPNNEAFSAAASAFANASVETLVSVLTYHAVAGAVVFASDITNTTVSTVNGNDLTLSVGTDGTVYVDNAKVVLPNIILANGVAHIIDTVLNPEDEVESPTPAATPTPAFPGATAIGTDVPFTSAVNASDVGSINIPAIATTAQFVSSVGGNGTAPTATAAPTTAPSEFPGAAAKLKGALGGAAIGLGMALVV